MKTNTTPTYTPPQRFIDWLEGENGRGAYFCRIDPILTHAMISKMKFGHIPITLEYAIRIERAQKPSNDPLAAIDIMTFLEHRALYRYAIGAELAPPPVEVTRRPHARRNLARAEA